MTNEEKHAILDVFEQTKKPEGNELSILKTFASDPDPFIRSRLPIFLMDFLNTESLSILFQLAKDNDWFVRTEAFDTMEFSRFKKSSISYIWQYQRSQNILQEVMRLCLELMLSYY